MLEIKNLSVAFETKEILHNININVQDGARHLLSGHNGSGKSTLVSTIAGDPKYKITSGQILLEGTDITNENATNRALRGIFIGAQNVPEIPGLTVLSFLKHSISAHMHFDTGRDLSMAEFLSNIEDAREQLSIPRDWLNRYINVGFSGGERKKIMLLRLIMTKPKLAILDEADSGSDAETQKLIATTVKQMPETTFMFISHQSSFADLISPTDTTTISNGKII
ncbi:MAG: Fe-S cluster assembly ATPase SufC [Proteobacteria bacterium]|nr:Fe-S cluster assembly ATPase SufC [Candidatus Enterousia scatequi]